MLRRVVVLTTLALAACTSPSASEPVRVGLWGGDHLAFTVTTNGAHLEFDCATGEIRQPLTVDSHGDFAVDGELVTGPAGPVTPTDPPPRTVRYTGHVSGNTLTLGGTLTDTRESVGSFSVVFGATPRLTKCR